MMFTDYPHKINIKKGQKYFKKVLDNQTILKKEYIVLEYLEPLNVTPKVKSLQKNSYFEEFISGNLIRDVRLTKEIIREIAQALKSIHNFEISEVLRSYLRNEFIVSGRYNPQLILEKIFEKAPKSFLVEYESRLIVIYKKLKDYFDTKEYDLSILHGDLSPNNIIVSDDGIKIIDWSDCRFDIASVDVVQLFYLNNMNKFQREVFLKYYDSRFIDEKVIWSHMMLHYIYDFVDNYIKKGEVSYKLMLMIKNYLNEYEE